MVSGIAWRLIAASLLLGPNVAFGDVLAAVSTFQGKMLLNFMFPEPTFKPETMEILANNVVSCIVDACTNEKLTFALWSD